MSLALVFQHGQLTPSPLCSALKLFGFELEAVDRDVIQDHKLRRYHRLQIHLGSDWSVVDGASRPEVECELRAIQRAILGGVPVLGICFGAQLLSLALGGSVIRSEEPEIGWYQLDSKLIEVTRATRWMQWHYDSIVAPQCTDVLIAGKFGAQAFRYGNCLGLQFHPEVDYEEIVRWMSEGGEQEVSRLGISSNALLEESRVYSDQSILGFFEVFEWFLSLSQEGGSQKV